MNKRVSIFTFVLLGLILSQIFTGTVWANQESEELWLSKDRGLGIIPIKLETDQEEKSDFLAESSIRLSPLYSLKSLGKFEYSSLTWKEVKPPYTSVNIEVNLSLDGGTTWSGWQQGFNNKPIPGITKGTDLSQALIQVKQTLKGGYYTDAKPLLYDLTMYISTGINKGPEVWATSPSQGSDGVGVDSIISISFSEGIQEGQQFNRISFTNNQGEDIDFSVEIKDKNLLIKPLKLLDYEKTYHILIPRDSVRNNEQKGINLDYRFKFRTEKIPNLKDPYIVGYQLVADKRGDNGVLYIDFSAPIKKGPNFKDIKLSSNHNNISEIMLIDDITLMIIPKRGINLKNQEYLYIPRGAVADLKGNSLEDTEIRWSINTKDFFREPPYLT